MKITVAKKSIAAALQHCCATAPKNSTMPILKCILLDPGNGGFRMRAANEGIKMAVSCLVEAQISAPRQLCVAAHDLLDRVKALPDGEIDLTEKDGKLTLKSGSRRLSLSVLESTDFPNLPEPDNSIVTLPAALLARALRSVVFAVNDDSSSSQTHGLRILVKDGELRVSGCDGYRVSYFRVAVDSSADFTALVPKPSALLLRSVSDSAEGDAQISTFGTTLFVTIGSVTFAAVTMNPSVFPPIQNVFPPERASVEVISAAAIESLRALGVVAGRLGKVRFWSDSGELRVSVQSEENGDSTDSFAAVGAEFSPRFVNANYLVDSIAACASESVRIDCGDPGEPIIITGGDVAGSLMPLIA